MKKMELFIFAVIITTYASLTSIGMVHSIKAEAPLGCQDFTVDKCEYDDGGLLETIKDISEDDCQFFCNSIYTGICTFFIFDRQQIICELLQQPFGNYINSCQKVAGPPEPLVSSCRESEDECKVLMVP